MSGVGSRNPGCDLVNLGGERSSGTGVDTLEATGETAVHGAECSVNSSSMGSQSRPVSRDRSGLDPKPGSSVTSGSGAWDCGSNSMRSGHASTFLPKAASAMQAGQHRARLSRYPRCADKRAVWRHVALLRRQGRRACC
jgi:hypothetical protein